MKPTTLLMLTLSWMTPAIANATPDARAPSEKKEQNEKKGALKERVDPVKDEKAQKLNQTRLERNAQEDRRAGNRIGAWAAEGDAKHSHKLIHKDERLIESGRDKQAVDGQPVKK